jgi:hypothetical protein
MKLYIKSNSKVNDEFNVYCEGRYVGTYSNLNKAVEILKDRIDRLISSGYDIDFESSFIENSSGEFVYEADNDIDYDNL